MLISDRCGKNYFHFMCPDCPSRNHLVAAIPPACVLFLGVNADISGPKISLANLVALFHQVFLFGDCCNVGFIFVLFQHKTGDESADALLPALRSAARLLSAHVMRCVACRRAVRFCSAGSLCSSGDAPSGRPRTFTTTTVAAPVQSANAASRRMLPDAALVLCRTCTSLCHIECWLPSVEQCRHCATHCVSETNSLGLQ
jgi:hypothetical protein